MNNKGNILIYVLMILMVLSILSIGVYGISQSYNREAQFTLDNSQAYYISKIGVELVISDIENILKEMGNELVTTFNMNLYEGITNISIRLEKDKNILKNIYIESVGEVNGSKNKLQAKLTKNNDINNSITILGVDKEGIIYEFDEDFETVKIKNQTKIKGYNSFAWDGKDSLFLVGDTKRKEDNCIVSDDLGETWIKNAQHQGNGLDFIVWSEEKQTFYATQSKDGGGSNSGHVFLFENGKWEKFKPSNNGFKIQRLIQGKKTLVGISKNQQGRVTYYREEDKKWIDKDINSYYDFNSITYGNGVFVIVGNDDSHQVIMYSHDGNNWSKGRISPTGTRYKLNDVTWNGKEFIAIGDANTIHRSIDGINWSLFSRDRIKHVNKDRKYYYDFKMISSNGNYIISYSENGNAVLISKDGGESWEQRIDKNYPKLKDILVINKGNGNSGSNSFDIKWSK